MTEDPNRVQRLASYPGLPLPPDSLEIHANTQIG